MFLLIKVALRKVLFEYYFFDRDENCNRNAFYNVKKNLLTVISTVNYKYQAFVEWFSITLGTFLSQFFILACWEYHENKCRIKIWCYFCLHIYAKRCKWTHLAFNFPVVLPINFIALVSFFVWSYHCYLVPFWICHLWFRWNCIWSPI